VALVTLGWKEFTDGVVLPASEINGYLQQGVLVFDDEAARTTALAGSLAEGMYSYLKSDKLTYLYNGSQWIRVGQPDLDTVKNFQVFRSSGSTTVPDWSTKMYYAVVGGGAVGTTSGGGNGGQVTQGNVAVSGGTSLSIVIGGSGSSSSLAVSGGSTFTGTGGGGAGPSGTGTLPSSPLDVAAYGGGGASGFGSPGTTATGNAVGHIGGGISWADGLTDQSFRSGQAGGVNSGGGGGRANSGTTSGGSGIVLLYFS
jgi:hypothetical protein